MAEDIGVAKEYNERYGKIRITSSPKKQDRQANESISSPKKHDDQANESISSPPEPVTGSCFEWSVIAGLHSNSAQ